MYIVFAILLFSFLIFIHEFGHFITAKLSGVQVNEFSLFMGPAIFKRQVGETLYAIRCIPIGGYCAMEGEDEDTDNPRSFQKAAWWKRLIILVAGAAMNFLTGLVLLLVVYLPFQQLGAPVISAFEEWSEVQGADALQVGDRFLEIDGEKVYTQSDVPMLLNLNPGVIHDLVVERDGQRVVMDDFNMVAHTFTDENGEAYSLYGFSLSVEEATLGGKLKYVWNTAMDNVRMVRLSLQMLLTGKAGLKDMSGPVGITKLMSDVGSNSSSVAAAVSNLLYFGAFIAINLAVMNLLPIPALDGGRVVCLLLTTLVEAITKKKINPKYEGYLHGAGMIVLLLFMAVVTFKDIFTIFKG